MSSEYFFHVVFVAANSSVVMYGVCGYVVYVEKVIRKKKRERKKKHIQTENTNKIEHSTRGLCIHLRRNCCG
jgi:hypothetical protein